MSFDLDKIAHLSRIALNEEDRSAMGPKLNQIGVLIDQLQNVDTTGIEPMTNPLAGYQRLRVDTVTAHDQHQKYQAIAPLVEAGLYLVPKVID